MAPLSEHETLASIVEFADQQQLGSIDVRSRLPAYCVGGAGFGQRCCWPLNADPLGGGIGSMIELDHLNVMVADVARSRSFYEKLLLPFEFPVNRDFGDFAVGFGAGPNAVLALVKSTERVQPIHLAFRVPTRAEVDHFYDSAMSLGATDNGSPGLRPHYHEHYYAAFVRDPDGHNLEVVCHLQSPAG